MLFCQHQAEEIWILQPFIYSLIYLSIYQIGRHTQKAKPLSKVSTYKKQTYSHKPTTTPNNAQQIQTTKNGSYLISLRISDSSRCINPSASPIEKAQGDYSSVWSTLYEINVSQSCSQNQLTKRYQLTVAERLPIRVRELHIKL